MSSSSAAASSSSLLNETNKPFTSYDEILIQRVLDYWFNDHDIAYNYKNRWFPGTISQLQQSKTDEEIYLNFDELYRNALDKNLQHWQQSINGSIALIIILDQFSRHILRWLRNETNEQQTADMLALEIAKSLHTRNVLNFSVSQYVFSLMPMRHTSTATELRYVLEKLSLKEDVELKSQELLNKFRKQTTRRLQHLQDREVLEATDDIMDRHAVVTDETNVMQHPLVIATEHFLTKHLPCSTTQATNHPLDIAAHTVFISLSGGVDSMVISKILKLLQINKPALRIQQILAMHIDYANRPESEREAQYVQHIWCEEILGIACKVRKVHEVTRGVTNRDDYEKISRDIRYEFYRQCIEEVTSSISGEMTNNSGVIFGHHLGDVQENVISNIMRGANPLYLSGMTDCSVSNGVNIWRPLLKYNKEEIYDFAHRYGVPYFKDSTPSWSTRGKLRTQLMPLLQDMYGVGCLQNLTQLAQESDETRTLVQNNLYEPFIRNVIQFPCGIKVNIVLFRSQPQCFWREALKQLMHSMGMSMVRDKAVSNFVERLQRPTASIQPGWLELRKGFHTLITQSGDLVILRDGCLKNNQNIQLHTPNTFNQRKQQLRAKQKQLIEQNKFNNSLLLNAIVELEEAINAIQFFHILLDNDNANHHCQIEFDRVKLSIINKFDFQNNITKVINASESDYSSSLTIGPWLLRIQACPITSSHSNNDNNQEIISFQNMEDILPGCFTYEVMAKVVTPYQKQLKSLFVIWYQIEIVRILYSEVLLQLEVSSFATTTNAEYLETQRKNIIDFMNKELLPDTNPLVTMHSLLNEEIFIRDHSTKEANIRTKTNLDMYSIDAKIMYGLPILLPIIGNNIASTSEQFGEDEKSFRKLQINYTYIR